MARRVAAARMTYSLPDQFDRVAPGKAGRRPPVGAVGLFFFVTALSPEFECDPDPSGGRGP